MRIDALANVWIWGGISAVAGVALTLVGPGALWACGVGGALSAWAFTNRSVREAPVIASRISFNRAEAVAAASGITLIITALISLMLQAWLAGAA